MATINDLFQELNQSGAPSSCSLSGECTQTAPSDSLKEVAASKRSDLPGIVQRNTDLASTYAIPTSNPRELGDVNFIRSLDEAAKIGKPIFLQFQEIPGCHTCTNFGDDVLRDPLFVELVETVFTPCVIYNNTNDPADLAALDKYNEPAWNNPVVHVVHPTTLQDIVPRVDGVYDLRGVLLRVLEALVLTNHPVPTWVDYLAVAYDLHVDRQGDQLKGVRKARLSTTTISMECYWAGETFLGAIRGVVSTIPGWCDGVEIVEVVYDTETLSYLDLVDAVMKAGFVPMIHNENEMTDASSLSKLILDRREGSKLKPLKNVSLSEVKYHLHKKFPHFSQLALTEQQAAHGHSLAARSQSQATLEHHILSPRQVRILHLVEHLPRPELISASRHDIWSKTLQLVESSVNSH